MVKRESTVVLMVVQRLPRLDHSGAAWPDRSLKLWSTRETQRFVLENLVQYENSSTG